MRLVLVGASELAVSTAILLVERGHEVVIVEANRDRIDELSETLDCSFLHGDGSRPQILREVNPKDSDILFCLTDNDQNNIIAGLVGRTLGFKRVVVNIHDPEFQDICRELGLEDTIIPTRTISRYLADMVSGVDILELSTIIKGEARFFYFKVDKQSGGKSIGELELPERARVICYYRDGRFALAEEETTLKKGDEVVVICHSESLPELEEQFTPTTAADSKQSEKEED